jgi:hypothetical protein
LDRHQQNIRGDEELNAEKAALHRQPPDLPPVEPAPDDVEPTSDDLEPKLPTPATSSRTTKTVKMVPLAIPGRAEWEI